MNVSLQDFLFCRAVLGSVHGVSDLLLVEVFWFYLLVRDEQSAQRLNKCFYCFFRLYCYF